MLFRLGRAGIEEGRRKERIKKKFENGVIGGVSFLAIIRGWGKLKWDWLAGWLAGWLAARA